MVADSKKGKVKKFSVRLNTTTGSIEFKNGKWEIKIGDGMIVPNHYHQHIFYSITAMVASASTS
jgi:hypothetical protein